MHLLLSPLHHAEISIKSFKSCSSSQSGLKYAYVQLLSTTKYFYCNLKNSHFKSSKNILAENRTYREFENVLLLFKFLVLYFDLGF